MSKTILKLLGLGLILATLACVGVAPTVAPLDPNSIDTAIAETMAAAATQTSQIMSLMVTPSSTVTITKIPSATPYPTFTAVVAIPRVFVTKNTHCRAGPGEKYKSLGALKVGQAVQVAGRSKDAKYWIIRNPSNLSQFCWLSGKYASVVGAAGALPVFTAPPPPTATRTRKPPTRTPRPPETATLSTPGTPETVIVPGTPDFTVSYSNTVNCLGDSWYVQLNLTNTGTATLQSIGLLVEDTTTGVTMPTLILDDFVNSNGCSTATLDTLPPGGSTKVSLPPLTYDPAGHTFSIGIGVCTEPALGGDCVADEITVTP